MEKWTIAQLKEELKKRGAALRGKKADLITRLQAYIRNNNFVQEDLNADVVENKFQMTLPAADRYKDIHGESSLPCVTRSRIELFLQRFGKELSQGPVTLYKGQYLQYARFAEESCGTLTYVTGMCRAQMKQVCYKVDICINTDGSVSHSQCECAAGVGPYAHCKHVLVLLLAVQEVTDSKKITTAEVCTQRIQTFHKPKRPFNGSPVKSNKLKAPDSSDIFDPRPAHLRNVHGYTDMVKNLLINHAANVSVPSRIPLLQTISPANPFAISNDHDYVGDPTIAMMKQLKLCGLTKQDRDEIELNTRGQAKNKDWRVARACRLTSSKFKDIIHSTEKRNMYKLAESIINPQSFVSRATEHGVINESVALRKFEEVTGNTVQECGLFVDETHNFLAASPDGLLCLETVVEVKCPYSARNCKISPQTVPYLEFVDNKLKLKQNHSYFYQVMGQLMATQRQYCDFIVYTYVDYVVINIERDQGFIDKMLKPLQMFFENHFLPCLMDKHLYHGYTGQ